MLALQTCGHAPSMTAEQSAKETKGNDPFWTSSRNGHSPKAVTRKQDSVVNPLGVLMQRLEEPVGRACRLEEPALI
jgi:hypothetical protein